MKPKVYLETSIISYLVGRPNRDVIITARQQMTAEWWSREKPNFEVHVSEVVLEEAKDGDEDAVRRRLEAMKDLLVIPILAEAAALARVLLDTKVVPANAALDASHIAIASTNGMDYLLTWNFKHIANAIMRGRIERVVRSRGFEPPVLCTPEELLEDS